LSPDPCHLWRGRGAKPSNPSPAIVTQVHTAEHGMCRGCSDAECTCSVSCHAQKSPSGRRSRWSTAARSAQRSNCGDRTESQCGPQPAHAPEEIPAAAHTEPCRGGGSQKTLERRAFIRASHERRSSPSCCPSCTRALQHSAALRVCPVRRAVVVEGTCACSVCNCDASAAASTTDAMRTDARRLALDQRGGGGPSLSNLGAARVLVGLPPRHVHTLNRPAGWQSGTAGPAPPRPTPIARRCHARYPRGACCTPAGACMPAPTVCVRVVRMQRAGGASLGAEPGWCVAGVCALPALPWRILPAAQAMERPARVEHVQHHGGRWTDPPAPFATDTGTNA
jgi:hypothetical protein